MAQRESRLSRDIMRKLRLHGVFCFKVHGGPTMMAGLPDIIACVDGLFVGLETKHPETRSNVSLKQDHVHGEIRRAGGRAIVVCSAEEALEFVQALRAHQSCSE